MAGGGLDLKMRGTGEKVEKRHQRQGRKESSNFTSHGHVTLRLSKAWLGVLKEDKRFGLVIMGNDAGN